jgi:sigma-54 dependent transcriptional regulator, acetoin dehydrogenase operon transcriptional activator AcoR
MRHAKDAPHAGQVYAAAQNPALALRAPTIDISWQRCLNDFNLDPVREYRPKVLDQSTLKARQGELEDLVLIARAEMDSLYEQISGSGYALLLADTQGVILCEKVDPNLKRMFADAGLLLGAEWSEQCEGTNGIGTCVTEARSITIHQADHFRSRHIGLSCSAAPIHDAYGQVIAVLDASCVNTTGPRESQLHTVALVNLSARLIEKCLFLRHHQGDAMLRFHHRPEFVDLLHDGAIAVGSDGSIVGSDAMGLKLLGAQHRGDLVGRSVADVFDMTYQEILNASHSSQRAMWELRDSRYGRRYFASLVEAGQQNARISTMPALSSRTIIRIPCDRSSAPLSLEDLAGDDPQMLRNLRNAQRVGESTVSVLIHGATGCGKEAFAKAMHLASSRAAKAFIPVNCAAIPETLIEAELFGYAPGAFTGARREGMRGRILQSSGGTLFLDEIGDMPLLMQTRLLRVLEEQEVTPLGSEVTSKVDLRVICASHRDLRDLVARQQFREDLFYRLNGITLELPPLATRRDRETVIRKCIAREYKGGPAASIEAQALEKLVQYSWPGNVRELRNAVRAALALCEDQIIRNADLPTVIQQFRAQDGPAAPAVSSGFAPPAGEVSLQSAERDALMRAIELHQGNMTLVAAHLSISRNTLYRKIKRHGITLTRRADGVI